MIWKNPIFWKKFLDLEITEKKLKASDDVFFRILTDIVFKMNDLNLDNKLILSIVGETLAKKVIKKVRKKLIIIF